MEKNYAAVALGAISTPKKAEAARENGRKGGAPIKFKGATYGGDGDVCYKCAKPLVEGRIVRLNLDREKSMFVEYDTGECFPFGSDCAKRVVNKPF